MPKFTERLQHAWNAFRGREPTYPRYDYGGSSYRPDRMRFTRGNERSIVASIYNRIALDCVMIEMQHVIVDENGMYKGAYDSGLNKCLTLSANVDQTGMAFRLDAIMSMFDEGVVALVPTDTSIDPNSNTGFDIQKIRVGKIVSWYPDQVRVEVYNELAGRKQEIYISKSSVAIVENPLYSIMNEPNSILQRLIRKINLLDYVDEQASSGKLDLIIQLPYVIKSEARRKEAEQRRKDIERQLSGTKYGIAYTDGTERITQLNRAVENNIWQEVKDLTAMLYNQLGLTESIFDGTADEKVMINYYNRTVDPILKAFADEMERKFITQNGRTRGQSIRYFRNPFRLVPVNELAEIADKLTRNEILSSNEIRSELGYKASDDPRANELRNSNLNRDRNEDPPEVTSEAPNETEE